MKTQGYINSFNKGIDTDTSVNKYGQETYYDALDVRIASTNALSNGALVNVPGTKALVKFTNFGESVVASTVVRDDLFLFTKLPHKMIIGIPGTQVLNDEFWLTIGDNVYKFYVAPDIYNGDPAHGFFDYFHLSDNVTAIAAMLESHTEISNYYKIEGSGGSVILIAKGFDDDEYSLIIHTSAPANFLIFDTYLASLIYKLSDYKTIEGTPYPTLLYDDGGLTDENRLNFGASDFVSLISRYETDQIRKLYWSNGIDPLRYLQDGKDYIGYDVNVFDYIPEVSLSRPSDTLINGGGLMNGIIQYSYQYYNKHGSSTIFAPADDIIRLSNASIDGFGGGNIGTKADKSVRVSFTDLDMSFDNIRIISIFYDTLNALPVINIVAELPIVGSSISIVDSGRSLGVISLEEYRLYNQNSIIPKVIESKDNILFVGNIKEDMFSSSAIDDWDSRAYGFYGILTPDTAAIYENPDDDPDGVRYELSSNGNWNRYNAANAVVETNTEEDWSIPDDFNSCNLANSTYDNDLDWRIDMYHPTKFQDAGSSYVTKPRSSVQIYGGLGKNVEYTFIKYKSKTSDGVKTDKFYPENTSGYYTITGQECQPNEVYRIGIKFFNKKGQSSFVKWIADVRWPSFGLKRDSDGDSWASMLEVTVNTFPSGADIAGYQIVRADRKDADVSIEATGVISPLINVKNRAQPYMFPIPIMHYDIEALVLLPNMVEFLSPETIFNNVKNANREKSKLITCAHSTFDSNYTEVEDNYGIVIDYDQISIYDDSVILSTESFKIESIIDTKATANLDSVAVVSKQLGGKEYRNQVQYFSLSGSVYTIHASASRCSGPILLLDSNLDVSRTLDGVNIAHMISDKDISRYGGYSYEDRSNTIYIQFSGYRDISSDSTICEYGDVFGHPFNLIRALFYKTGDLNSVTQLLTSHLPSRIDTSYSVDDIKKHYVPLGEISTERIDGKSGIDNFGFVQETVTDGILLYPETYDVSIGNLYTYNPVYSQSRSANISIVKPYDFDTESYFPTKVHASNVKQNSEINDSWLNFLTNNFIDVDGQYGELTKIKSFKGTLLFFQKNAIGILSVNQRSLIQDNQVGQLSLGTGGILDHFDYISYYSGADTPEDVIASRSSLYFIDKNAKRIYTVDSPDISFSEVGGVHSLLNDVITVDNKRLCGFDTENNEVLFSIGDKTLCYNENTRSFISRYGFIPDYYITTPEGLYSSKFDGSIVSDSYVFEHNAGDKGSWYKEIYNAKSVTSITLLINPNGNLVNSFDNIDLRTEVYSSNENSPVNRDLVNETISRAKFKNSYISEISVESATSGLTPKIKRLARSWRAQVPLTANGNRFVDTYLMLTLEFDNNSNKLFKLHDVITYFREAKY